MELAETLVPLLPLTPTGFITLKADHPRRVWELDETYHAAQQTSFRDTTWQQNKTTFLFLWVLFWSRDNFEKMTVATNGEDGITRPY